jgi:hypothetical protein
VQPRDGLQLRSDRDVPGMRRHAVYGLQRELRDRAGRLPDGMLGRILELTRRLYVDLLRALLSGQPRSVPRELSDRGGLPGRLRVRQRLCRRLLRRRGERRHVSAGAVVLAPGLRFSRGVHDPRRERGADRAGATGPVRAVDVSGSTRICTVTRAATHPSSGRDHPIGMNSSRGTGNVRGILRLNLGRRSQR